MDLRKYYDRNFIVCGIARSGTSLFSVLMNSFDNVVCLNEVFYNVITLPGAFLEIRERLLDRKPIPNKFTDSGELATDSLRDDGSLFKKEATAFKATCAASSTG